MIFRDRIEAAELLAEKLSHYQKEDPLILAIPRGAVPMGKVLADRLQGDLDVVLVHKIGAPGNPEFAIGSVSEFGKIYRSEATDLYGIPLRQVEEAANAEIERLRRRRQSYSLVRQPVTPTNRTVIIVDDGIATGSTMLAAVSAIRSQRPKRIVVAAPVASRDTAELVGPQADELVFLDTPEEFFGISQFYDDFRQVTDEEVLRILSRPTATASKSA